MDCVNQQRSQPSRYLKTVYRQQHCCQQNLIDSLEFFIVFLFFSFFLQWQCFSSPQQTGMQNGHKKTNAANSKTALLHRPAKTCPVFFIFYFVHKALFSRTFSAATTLVDIFHRTRLLRFLLRNLVRSLKSYLKLHAVTISHQTVILRHAVTQFYPRFLKSTQRAHVNMGHLSAAAHNR